MATPDDDTTTAPPPVAPPTAAATPDMLAQAQAIAQQFLPAPVQVDTTPVKRSWLSLLGEAVGGGKTIPMSPADEQRAGLRALGDFGTSLMAASHYQPGQTVFSNLAQGFQGAERSMTGSEQMAAGTLAAQQGYQQQQLQNRLEALKQAIPLLRMQQAAGMPNSLLGGGGGGGGLGATGAPIGGAAPAFTGDLEKDRQIIAQRESGGDPTALNYVAKADPTAYGRGATASGKYQFVNSTWQDGLKLAGLDPSKYPTAMSAPESVQDQVFTAVYKRDGTKPWDPTQWKQNWVPTPTGQMILANVVPGAPKTATAPPAPTTPPAASTAPPGVQMGGAVPPPPGGAPGAAATPYQAAGAGIGRVLTDTTGKVGPQQVTVAPPPPNAVPIGKGTPIPTGKLLPKVADNVAAIQAGRQLAQIAPPVTALTAGPGAPTATATAAPAAVPQPGWGSTVGTYGLPGQTPPSTPPSVTPPAQPTPQQPTQADQPPAPTGPLTIEQYRALHPSVIDPSTYTVTPNPKALADAEAERQTAAQNLQQARAAGDNAAANKALNAATEASSKIATLQQQAVTDTARMRLDAQAKAETLTQQGYNDAMTRQQQAQLKAQELAQTVAENEKNRQADIRKAELAAGYTAEQSERQADIDIAKNDITDRTAQAQKSSQIIPVLQQMQGQFGNLPTGFIGGLLAKYDTTGDLTGMLARMGVVDPSKATAAQLLIAARNYLSIETKPAATGSLRLPEMDKLQSFTPGQLDTPQAQQEMIGRLIAYQKRIQDERTFAGNYFGRTDPTTGKRIYDNRGLETAMNAPVQYNENGVVTGGGLGPVVPEPPPLNRPDAEHQAYLNYIRRNVAPGMPYQSWEPKTNPDGSTVRDARGQPIPQRVTKTQGYQ